MDFLTEPFLISPNKIEGRVLVTGAGGCIGAWVLAILDRSGVPVVAADLQDERSRPALVMGADRAAALNWQVCDVTDFRAVSGLLDGNDIGAIIHLAGLQVPFCAANPALGARVNVEGTINIFEAARAGNISRLAYASSVAALAFPAGGPYRETLYGAYKVANEQTAHVYWQDWQVPSVGLRPNVVYGVARDQGMSSKNTIAIQAAAMGRPFDVPFTGPYSWLYAGEAAAAFIAAICQTGEGAHVFDLNGRTASVEAGLDILRDLGAGESAITCSGTPFPFPADLPETDLRRHVPEYPSISVAEGIAATYRAFRALADAGRLPPLPE